jgi:lipoprotein-anchoring transpeptidase ErfK/SrfK
MLHMFKIPFDDDQGMFPEVKFSGRGLWVKPPIPERKPIPFKYPRGRVIVINRTEQIVKAYENGVLMHTFEAVLGNVFKRTPPGCHYIVEWKDPDHKSGEFGGTLMHWAVFFVKGRGIALHQYHGDTSDAAWKKMRKNQATEGSVGCVRLREPDAVRVYDFAQEITTKVWVVDQWPEHGGCMSPGDWLDVILEGIYKLKSTAR